MRWQDCESYLLASCKKQAIDERRCIATDIRRMDLRDNYKE
jgi:hypothetical protein